MGRWSKFRAKLVAGKSDRNIDFSDITGYLSHLGFEERIRGSHHIYVKDEIDELLNLQSKHDGSAKPYQVKQVREIVLEYRLGEDDA